MSVGVVHLGYARGRVPRVALAVVFLASAAVVAAQPAVPPVRPVPTVPTVPAVPRVEERPPGRDAPPIENPAGAVSLRDALALALLHNPALATFAWEARALEARILQAGRLPNPTLDLTTEDVGAARTPGRDVDQPVQPQTTLQLSQLIELGGKRTSRQRVAALDRDLAAWDYEMARIDVLSEVSRAFTRVLVAQDAVTLAETALRIVTEGQQSVVARVEAGVVSPIEETRANVAVASARADAARARRALDASRTRLALLWGSPAAAFTSATGDLTGEPPPLPPVGVLTALLDQNPNLARWAAEMSQREAALALERSKRVVDIAVSAGYRRYTTVDSNAFVVGASIPLPLFNRNAGGIEEARLRLAKSHDERRVVEARVAAALTEAYAALAAAHDEIAILRAAVLPGAQQTFDAISEGYRLGRFSLLDVLDAQRTLTSAGSQHLRALSDYHDAVVQVERLIGAPLPGSPGLVLRPSPSPKE